MGNHRSNPKQNGVLGHPFLLLSHQDEESGALGPELLRPAVIPLESSGGAEHLVSCLRPQSQPVNSSKRRSYTEGFFVWEEQKDTKLSSLRVMHPAGKAAQPANSFG